MGILGNIKILQRKGETLDDVRRWSEPHLEISKHVRELFTSAIMFYFETNFCVEIFIWHLVSAWK